MSVIAPVSDPGRFWSYRMATHAGGWLAAAFCAGWVVACVELLSYFSVVGSILGGLVLAFVALCIYGTCCLYLVPLLVLVELAWFPTGNPVLELEFPLLPFVPLAWLSVALEWRWRAASGRPWTPPSPRPYVAPVTPVIKPPSAQRKASGGGCLLPLALGLWIGSSWGDDA